VPISTRQLYRVVVEAAEAADIAKRVGPHTLRHYLPNLTMSRSATEALDSSGLWGLVER